MKIECSHCKKLKPAKDFVRMIMVTGVERKTKQCIECRNRNSTNKRAASLNKRAGDDAVRVHDWKEVKWADLIDLAINS